ncbi:RidA family protein [Pseudonocardia spinosispora]|uniref:RidA family protein n=1 Tax=Pseudonocardia spinosispora TaxID=103441 RepID=UPI00048AE679|nr:Rid family detoxifying hydrolase [Pseudonocardia spinosispora]
MSPLKHVTADNAPAPKAAYSQAVHNGSVLYTAGFGPHDPSDGSITGTTIAEQTDLVLRNVRATLIAAGADLTDVMKVTVHLSDLADFADFEAVYRRFFTAPYPARTTVASTLPGILVEIDVVAALPS